MVDLAGEKCAISISRDVTELKQVQTDLMATVAELRETQQRLKAEISERERTIVERERAESQLRQSEDKLRRIFESCPDSICINRMSDGTYVECNNEFFNTGYTKDDLARQIVRDAGRVGQARAVRRARGGAQRAKAWCATWRPTFSSRTARCARV